MARIESSSGNWAHRRSCSRRAPSKLVTRQSNSDVCGSLFCIVLQQHAQMFDIDPVLLSTRRLLHHNQRWDTDKSTQPCQLLSKCCDHELHTTTHVDDSEFMVLRGFGFNYRALQLLPHVFPVLRHLGFTRDFTLRWLWHDDRFEATLKKHFGKTLRPANSDLDSLPACGMQLIDLYS